MDTSKFKTFIFSKTAFVLSLVLLAVFVRATWSVSTKARQTKDNLELVREEYSELQDREVRLESEIEYLKTEQGIEAEIRDKFNVARAGESVVVIVDGKEESNESRVVEEEKLGFWGTIGSWFKKTK